MKASHMRGFRRSGVLRRSRRRRNRCQARSQQASTARMRFASPPCGRLRGPGQERHEGREGPEPEAGGRALQRLARVKAGDERSQGRGQMRSDRRGRFVAATILAIRSAICSLAPSTVTVKLAFAVLPPRRSLCTRPGSRRSRTGCPRTACTPGRGGWEVVGRGHRVRDGGAGRAGRVVGDVPGTMIVGADRALGRRVAGVADAVVRRCRPGRRWRCRGSCRRGCGCRRRRLVAQDRAPGVDEDAATA